MTSQEIQRTEYLVPGSGLPRLGPTTHAESAIDVSGYLRPLEQVHGSTLHGLGVADGLAVSAAAGSASVTIAPGVAMDTTGRHISLAVGGMAEISADPVNSSQLVPVTPTGVTLPTTGNSGTCVVTATWRETFDQALFAASQQKIYQDNHTPWLRVSPAGSTGADDVVLATVSLDASGNVLTDGLTADGRHGPAPAVEAMQLKVATSGGGTVSTASAGWLRASPGSLQLHATDPASHVEIAAEQGNVAQLALGADRVSVRRQDGTDAIILDTASTQLGVGTSSPRNPLGVRASQSTEELVSFENPAGQTKWHINQNPGGNNPGLNVAESDVADGRLFVQPGGNLGVNTTAPTNPLHVAGDRGIRQNSLYLSGAAGWSSLTYNAHHNDSNTNWEFPDPSRGAVTIEMDESRVDIWSTTRANTTGWIERFHLDANTGRVGIGTGSPNFDLDVNGTVCAKVFCNPSDVRVKRDIAPLANVLDRLAGVRAVSYRPADADAAGRSAAQIGVLAQEVQAAFPELVLETEPGGLKAVDYAGLSGVLVGAVRELLATNAALTARLSQLERVVGLPAAGGGEGAGP